MDFPYWFKLSLDTGYPPCSLALFLVDLDVHFETKLGHRFLLFFVAYTSEYSLSPTLLSRRSTPY